MAKAYLILFLLVQSILVFAETDVNSNECDEGTSREVLKNKPKLDEEDKDSQEGKKDWMDMFFLPIPNNQFYPTSSAALMSQVTNSDKSAEEQLEDIKEMANKITLAIQSEMANLLSYALSHCEKEEIDNNLRKKRETPMDSSQLVMRLLKHIKANNEYQNIAIEKMMTAQEIADKFGIEFNPDPDMLSDLAFAANEQAKEMTSILKDACDAKNATVNATEEHVEFIPVDNVEQCPAENNTYYVYSVHQPESQDFHSQYSHPPHEYMPEHFPNSPPPMNHGHHEHHHYTHHDQMMPMPPPHHHMPPVTPRPNYYDVFTPEYPYCPVEPITTTTTIILPIEEIVEPEPELIGEEYEETVSSKMIVSRDEEPGTATVNHVMTYTLSEKAHFRKPEIEQMPQQMQYTFFLM